VRAQDWRANYYEAIRERNGAEAKLEKVAKLLPDLERLPGGRLFAEALDNILFPCDCPGEHCGECGCCP
jgi:hypothetical protein